MHTILIAGMADEVGKSFLAVLKTFLYFFLNVVMWPVWQLLLWVLTYVPENFQIDMGPIVNAWRVANDWMPLNIAITLLAVYITLKIVMVIFHLVVILVPGT